MAPPKEKKIYIYRKTYYIIIMYYICICDTRFLILYRDITFLELEGWLSEGPEVVGSSCLWGAGVESGKLGQLVSIMAQGEQFDSKTFTSLARIKIRAKKKVPQDNGLWDHHQFIFLQVLSSPLCPVPWCPISISASAKRTGQQEDDRSAVDV